MTPLIKRAQVAEAGQGAPSLILRERVRSACEEATGVDRPCIANPVVQDAASYDAGYRAGQEAGREAAYAAGEDAGRKAGWAQGRLQAMEEARQDAGAAMQAAVDAAVEAALLAAGKHEQDEAMRASDAAQAGAASLQKLHERLGSMDGELRSQAEALAIELAWTALLRLLGEAAGRRETVAAAVRAVLGEAAGQEVLRICLSPADLALLQSGGSTEFDSFTLVADAGIELGGCIADTAAGTLDGRLESQLQSLKQVLLARAQAGEAQR